MLPLCEVSLTSELMHASTHTSFPVSITQSSTIIPSGALLFVCWTKLGHNMGVTNNSNNDCVQSHLTKPLFIMLYELQRTPTLVKKWVLL